MSPCVAFSGSGGLPSGFLHQRNARVDKLDSRGRKAERYEDMNVGEGSLGSRVCADKSASNTPAITALASMSSFAFFAARFFRHLSTDAAACSSWNRSRMVVAVKSAETHQPFALRERGLVDSPLTASSRRSRCSKAAARRFKAFPLSP